MGFRIKGRYDSSFLLPQLTGHHAEQSEYKSRTGLYNQQNPY